MQEKMEIHQFLRYFLMIFERVFGLRERMKKKRDEGIWVTFWPQSIFFKVGKKQGSFTEPTAHGAYFVIFLGEEGIRVDPPVIGPVGTPIIGPVGTPVIRMIWVRGTDSALIVSKQEVIEEKCKGD